MPRHDSSCESSRVESSRSWPTSSLCSGFAFCLVHAHQTQRRPRPRQQQSESDATNQNDQQQLPRRPVEMDANVAAAAAAAILEHSRRMVEGGGGRMVGKALSLSLSLANHKSVKYDLPLACAASAWTCTRALALGWIAAAVAADADSVHEMSASSKPAQSAMRSPVAAIFDCLRSCQRLDSGCQRLLDVARGWQLLPEVANDCLLLPTFAKGC